MGKGDRKTAKGKRYNSSYGNARPQITKVTGDVAAAAAGKTATKAVSKAPAKKTVAKKAAAKPE